MRSDSCSTVADNTNGYYNSISALSASESLFPLFGKVKNAMSACLDRLLWQYATQY